LYDRFDCVKDIFNMSADIRDLCFNGPKEQLDITVNTQPAVFMMDMACAAALTGNGIKPTGVAGFSLGEIPAVCYAGLMNTEQSFKFVRFRAEAMHDCTQKSKGTMFAVLKLDDETIEKICVDLPEAYPVNYNSPGQVVVACAEGTAEELQQAVVKAGGKSMKLAVSGAFHSPFMDDASKNAGAYLENEVFGEINIPVYSNRTARIYDKPIVLLAEQINHPVLWKRTIENMIDDGFGTFIEMGPGKTLSGLIKKINPDVCVYNVSDVVSFEAVINEMT